VITLTASCFVVEITLKVCEQRLYKLCCETEIGPCMMYQVAECEELTRTNEA
jgi:hypothetical protein